MSRKKEMLFNAVKALQGIADAINNLSVIIKDLGGIPTTTTVEYNKVVWLDDCGEYLLIWYADGTGQILHVEGRVTTISTVGRPGMTCYKLSDGRIMEFQNKNIRSME